MVEFIYHKGCRTCFVGKESSITAMTVSKSDCAARTEFEISLFLERIFKEKGVSCDVCGSNNIEIFDIKIKDDYSFFDYNKIADKYRNGQIEMMQLLINKENSKLSFDIGGEGAIQKDFLKTALQHIKNSSLRRENVFEAKSNGSLYICITGNVSATTGQIETVQFERFRTMGLSINDVVQSVDNLLRQHS
jgi:hypothetical protein